MKQSHFPPGWDELRVREVLAHYETQTEDEAVAEDEATSEELLESAEDALDAREIDRLRHEPRIPWENVKAERKAKRGR